MGKKSKCKCQQKRISVATCGYSWKNNSYRTTTKCAECNETIKEYFKNEETECKAN